MPSIGLERIRDLYKSESGAVPIKEKDPDEEAVGVVQDFLIEHGFLLVPDHTEYIGKKHVVGIHGYMGKTTRDALHIFFSQSLKPKDEILLDSKKIKELIDLPTNSPRSRLGRLSIKLGFSVDKMLKILSFVSLMEGGFWSCGRNKDKHGLSYGIIQWNQTDLRLREIVTAMEKDQRDLFKTIFVDVKGLIDHISKANGGTKVDDGTTTDPKYNLISRSQPWLKRFQNAGRERVFQLTQVKLALTDLNDIVTFVQGYATNIKSERGFAFMIDLTNQYGRAGAKTKVYQAAGAAGLEERIALRKMADISIGHSEANRLRREFFRDSRFLSDDAL